MENYDKVKQLPFIGNMINNQNAEEETKEEKVMISSLMEKYSKELDQRDDLLKKFELISTELIKMGFKPKMVLRTFLVHKYSTLDEGIEILSKTDNLWNHKFVECYLEKCFMCGEFENAHRSFKTILMKKNSIVLDDQKIKEAMNRQAATNYGSINKKLGTIIKSDSCPICFIEINDDMTFSMNCKHKFCKDCIIDYLKEEIRNARVKNIKCPEKKCDQLFSDELIKQLVNDDEFNKYLKFLERQKIKEQKNLIHCPIVDCEGFAIKTEQQPNDNMPEPLELDSPEKRLLDEDIVLNVSGEKEKVKYVCNKGHPFCGKCKSVWHSDDCNEDREVKDFATSTGHIVKKCVKCRVWTEKTEGCNHMTCQICKAEWCWLCEQVYTADHYTTPGPCFGRQFNEVDPAMLELLTFENQWPNLYSFLFIYIWSIFVINLIVRNNNNPNNQRRHSKCYLLGLTILFSGCTWFFAVIFNGFLGIYLIRGIVKTSEINVGCVRVTCLLTFILIFFIFFFAGIILSTLWLILINIYAIFKISFS
jgi:hypothetical protein